MRTRGPVRNHSRGARQLSAIFHLFLGAHSLLIGLFIFYTPVFLWHQGFGLSAISIYISISGLAFVMSLWSWDCLRKKLSLLWIFTISYVLALLLIGVNLLTASLVRHFDIEWGGYILLFLSALCYGAYNYNFWTTQRALFFENLHSEKSGRQFGNFQLFVAVLLQIGIVVGGIILELDRLWMVPLLSLLIAVIALYCLLRLKAEHPRDMLLLAPLLPASVVQFRDGYRSRTVFWLDGLFLFLESFYWTLSLFFISHESFLKLGILLLSLAVLFALLFYLIKNTIDHIAVQRVYTVAVLLYAASWALRAVLGQNWPLHWQFTLLVLIAFFTSLFRLAFNKRFFDIAHESLAQQYLLLKSYHSQGVLCLVFLFLAAFFSASGTPDSVVQLQSLYWLVTPVSLLYLVYRRATRS